VIALTIAPLVTVAGVAVILGCGLIGAVVLLGDRPSFELPAPLAAQVEHERDIAAALGFSWHQWFWLRVAVVAAGAAVGVAVGVPAFTIVLLLICSVGVRFAVAGRAARRRLRSERAFLAVLRELRDRMAVSNQSLDTALLEIAAQPPRELTQVLRPLVEGGAINQALVACAARARSPVVDQACGVLIWARTRSLDALIVAIDSVILPVGEAQLAVQEESLVTTAQQRAVTIAMAVLMLVMFASVLRVELFRAYYRSAAGTLVLLTVVGLFVALTAAVGRIARVVSWTRWDLATLAEREALHA